jgi:hypothetical protein
MTCSRSGVDATPFVLVTLSIQLDELYPKWCNVNDIIYNPLYLSMQDIFFPQENSSKRYFATNC